MKGKKWLEDNRGAALVSVMIAVAFIAILASTLLYMSYSNYQMKVINYESKVNFYGTEHDMTELSTAIRNDVMLASDPVAQLKTSVGFVDLDPTDDLDNGRYDPTSLAKLVYTSLPAGTGTASFPIDGNRNYNTSGKINVTFDTGVTAPTSPNFTITPDPGLDGVLGTTDDDNGITKLVTLKDVIIKQENMETGYVNKIQTDIVYRIKEHPQSGNSGIGDFSMIMDSPIDTVTNGPARITMYGSIMVGSGEYNTIADTRPYDPTALVPNGRLEGVDYAYLPASGGQKPALYLKGDTICTLVGDHIIIMGDIVLDGDAILNVVSGRMTVLGDVYVNGNSSFMCTGKLFFPYGPKPNNTAEYYAIKTTQVTGPAGGSGITTSGAGKTENILITGGTQQLSADNYKGLLSSLGLTDNDTTNDGVIDKLFKSSSASPAPEYTIDDYIGITGTEDPKSSGDYVDGIYYTTTINSKTDTTVNANDYPGSLVIFTDPGAGINDGSTLNTTFMSLGDFSFTNAKAFRYSQMGNDAFNKMLEMEIVAPDNSGDKIKIGDLFVSNPNSVMNTIINYASDGGGSTPTIETAIGYVNWVKE